MSRDSTITLASQHRVRFTRDALKPSNPVLSSVISDRCDSATRRLLPVIDRSLLHDRPDLPQQIAEYFKQNSAGSPVTVVGHLVMPGGEAVKNSAQHLDYLLAAIHRHRLDRHSFLLVIGGGALLDAAGFAAAIAHRGVKLIRMPTTTLAQADSGVGVKNGVNRYGQKNFLGTFAIPHAVINDSAWLSSLSDRDWRCGLAEAVKVALIRDADLFHQIRTSAQGLVRRDAAIGDPIWQRSAELHLQHIVAGGDPFETKSARPLDFGHWAAHKLEILSNHRLRHGEAVAIGIALDVTYSSRIGLLSRSTASQICRTFSDLGFSLEDAALADERLIAGLEDFRQHLGGCLTVTLIQDIAQPIDVHEVNVSEMRAAAGDLLRDSTRVLH